MAGQPVWQIIARLTDDDGIHFEVRATERRWDSDTDIETVEVCAFWDRNRVVQNLPIGSLVIGCRLSRKEAFELVEQYLSEEPTAAAHIRRCTRGME